ncbi:putative cell differentiation protein RCD1 -like protein [Capsicum annuum]|nr:putative cell differentiation protein RCD1 -like protein [Capsicum annuum]
MKESKIVEVFIQAQDEIYYQHLLPALGKTFIEVLKVGEMIEDEIKIGRIVSFATLKVITQVIQKGSGSVGEKKNEEDASAIVVGQQAWSKKTTSLLLSGSSPSPAQTPHNHSQNSLYSVPPPPYPVYNSQPYV